MPSATAPTTRARSGPGCSARSSRPGCACAAARAEAQARGPARASSAPLLDHLDEAGLGHCSEIADAEPPHTPRGCPFQAWSVGEVLRACRWSSRGRRTPPSRPRPEAGEEREMDESDGPARGAAGRGRRRGRDPAGDVARDRRAAPAGRGRPRRAALAALGPVPQRAAVGHGARGLQPATATPGTTSRTTTPAAAPTAGARTASPASATTSSGCASRSPCGTATTRSSRSGCSA